jgi:hypothetical protein
LINQRNHSSHRFQRSSGSQPKLAAGPQSRSLLGDFRNKIGTTRKLPTPPGYVGYQRTNRTVAGPAKIDTLDPEPT